MTERNEGQMVTQAPIKAILGGKEYEIKLLAIKESREWREKVANLLGTLPTNTKKAEFRESTNIMLRAMPNQVIDLVFDYAKNLPREEIELVATDAEALKAFGDIFEVAYLPFVQGITGAVGRLSQ